MKSSQKHYTSLCHEKLGSQHEYLTLAPIFWGLVQTARLKIFFSGYGILQQNKEKWQVYICLILALFSEYKPLLR